MTDPAVRRALLREALADSDDAPLSVRRALQVVMLVDALVDQRARRDRGDPLRVRTSVTSDSPELALVLELAAHRDGGPCLVVEGVDVPLTDYGTLSTAEFMVSLYDGHSVPRLLVALPDGGRRDAHELLHAAVRAADRPEEAISRVLPWLLRDFFVRLPWVVGQRSNRSASGPGG